MPKNAFTEEKESFPQFWKRFRTAAIKNDIKQIITLTHFPFKTKRTLDSDPITKYTKRTFPAVFTAFLKQWNGMDLEGKTESDLIKKTVTLNKKAVHDNYTRIGDLVFARTNKKWKLVSVYLNTETAELLKKNA